MTMSSDVKNKFAQAALSTFDLATLGNINKENALEIFECELNDTLALNDEKVMNQRHDFFKIEGSKAIDYQEKIFEIFPNGKVLAGIRHAGGNVEKPFISIWPDYRLESLVDLKNIYKLLDFTKFDHLISRSLIT